MRRQLADGRHAVVGAASGVPAARRPTAGSPAAAPGRRPRRRAARPPGASGLRRSDATLAHSLLVATPTLTTRPASSSTRCLSGAADRLAVAEGGAAGGHVHERLVEADRLHQRRVAGEDAHDLAAQLAIAIESARQEDAIGAEPMGRAQRHGGMHAEGAGLVGGGAHHAARVRVAADDDRLAAQRSDRRAPRRWRRTRRGRRAGWCARSGAVAAGGVGVSRACE